MPSMNKVIPLNTFKKYCMQKTQQNYNFKTAEIWGITEDTKEVIFVLVK